MIRDSHRHTNINQRFGQNTQLVITLKLKNHLVSTRPTSAYRWKMQIWNFHNFFFSHLERFVSLHLFQTIKLSFEYWRRSASLWRCQQRNEHHIFWIMEIAQLIDIPKMTRLHSTSKRQTWTLKNMHRRPAFAYKMDSDLMNPPNWYQSKHIEDKWKLLAFLLICLLWTRLQ